MNQGPQAGSGQQQQTGFAMQSGQSGPMYQQTPHQMPMHQSNQMQPVMQMQSQQPVMHMPAVDPMSALKTMSPNPQQGMAGQPEMIMRQQIPTGQMAARMRIPFPPNQQQMMPPNANSPAAQSWTPAAGNVMSVPSPRPQTVPGMVPSPASHYYGNVSLNTPGKSPLVPLLGSDPVFKHYSHVRNGPPLAGCRCVCTVTTTG